MRMAWLVGLGLITGAALLGAAWWNWRAWQPQPISPSDLAARLTPLPAPEEPVSIYHLGHSLVGRDMPAMLAQMAGNRYESQLGWGSSLKDHWEKNVAGFDVENAHPRHRPAAEALDSGDYSTIVFTEMVELKDSLRYHQSPRHLALWAERARKARPDVRLYLYETWHQLDDPAGWLERIEADRALWEGELLAGAMAYPQTGAIYVIPGGQVMAAAARAIEAGEVPGLSAREDLFARDPEGKVDNIHFNDIGAWLMAQTHYAVIWQKSPEGQPGALLKADGSPATPLPADTALALQKIVWRVVLGYPLSGIAQD